MYDIYQFLFDQTFLSVVVSIDNIRLQVRHASPEIEEIAHGYLFHYSDPSVKEALTQFIDHERLCCSFLDFDLYENKNSSITCEVVLNNENLDLHNVKEVILALFSEE